MPGLALDREARLAALREEVCAIAIAPRSSAALLPFGIQDIDTCLAEGGLVEAALHEVAGASCSDCDDAAASFFVTGIAARASSGGTVLWVRSKADLFGPGLATAGLQANRLIYVDAQCDVDVLAVTEDGLRHGGLAAVVCEVACADTTATRRLQLAAEEGGTMSLMLRRWRRKDADPLSVNSAAATRWRIGCAPSTPLPVVGVGRPRWNVSLVRQRGGGSWSWFLEGCDASGRLALPAATRDGSSSTARRAKRQAA